MVSYLPSSIQKRLLRYALLKTGLLATEELDLDDLDITLGRHNNVELRNVGLHASKLSSLLVLPPEIRIESARILQLKLAVPADLYYGSIVAEAHGLECDLVLVANTHAVPAEDAQERRFQHLQAPSHRKTRQRIERSPPPFDPGGNDDDEEGGVPTAAGLARSFLQEASPDDVSQLTSQYTDRQRRRTHAELGAADDENDIGTGLGFGLPSFLAGFLQGVVDRFQFRLLNIKASLDLGEAYASTRGRSSVSNQQPLRLLLQIHEIKLEPGNQEIHTEKETSASSSMREIEIHGINVSIVGLEPSRDTSIRPRDGLATPVQSFREGVRPPPVGNPAESTISAPTPITTEFVPGRKERTVPGATSPVANISADAGKDFGQASDMLDIRAGEDNLAWNFRRSGSGTVVDAFNDIDRGTDLATSVLADQHLATSRLQQGPTERTAVEHHSVSSPESLVGISQDSSHSSINLMDQAHFETTGLPERSEDHDLPISYSQSQSSIQTATADLSDEETFPSMYLSAIGSTIARSHHADSGGSLASNSTIRADLSRAVEPEADTVTSNSPGFQSASVPPPMAMSTRAGQGDVWTDDGSVRVFSAQSLLLRMATAFMTGRQDDLSDHEVPSISKKARSSSIGAEQMPGAFSVYAASNASVTFDKAQSQSQNEGSAVQVARAPTAMHMILHTARLSISIDLLAAYVDLVKLFSAVFSPEGETLSDDGLVHDDSKHKPPLSITIDDFSVDLVGPQSSLLPSLTGPPHCAGALTPSARDTLLKLSLLNTKFESNVMTAVAWSLGIGLMCLDIGSENILRFSSPMHESKRSILDSNLDLHIEAAQPLETLRQHKVLQYAIRMKQLELNLALDEIEDTFSSYGGLSSLLELSSSFTAAASSPIIPSPRRKGVHFEDSSNPSNNSSELKINARIDGLQGVLRTHTARIDLVSSAIKIVQRPEYIALAIAQAGMSGPFAARTESNESGAEVKVSNLRFEYLARPKDADLERLLSLLTPSKNKYEEDDDFLLDTLLRQRRKGGVFRLSTSMVQCKVVNWAILDSLKSLLDDLSGLAAVTKYLPDDERPGILALLSIQETQLQIPINQGFGSLNVKLFSTQAAHVGLPSLLALAIGEVQGGRYHDGDLIHSLCRSQTGGALPMVMAKLIGDEVEPTLRIKLFDVAVEYSVPILMALTDQDMEKSVANLVDIAASNVVELAKATTSGLPADSPSSSSVKRSKKLGLDLLLLDCGVGLTPQVLESKAILLFNNTKCTTIVPATEPFSARIEIRRATMLIIDSCLEISKEQSGSHVAVATSALIALTQEGFVSVATILAARADLEHTFDTGGKTSSTEVSLRNELFLMESCADSTRTLIDTLGALTPPATPNSVEKFRVEPMTVNDMVASFSGNAFEEPASPPSTLFDAEQAPFPDDDDLVDASMTESIYGGLDALEDPDEGLLQQDGVAADLAESMLDEDPFEIPDNPNAAKLSNRELQQYLDDQLEDAIESEPVVISPDFMSSAALDRVPGDSIALGAPYRWRTPATSHPRDKVTAQQKFPLTVRVRDVHIIWNLYDGYDWHGTRQAITQAVEEVEVKAEQRRMRGRSALDLENDESIIGDCLFNSIYIGVPASKEAQDLRRQINKGIDDLASESESYAASGVTKPTNVSGGSGQRIGRGPRRLKLERSRAHKIAFELRGVSADFLQLPPGEHEVQNTLDLRVRDLEIFDNLPTSTWRKFMTSWHKDDEEREMAKPMLHVEMQNVRPIKELSAAEIVLSVTSTPIRLHVDQDALDFITRFFAFKDNSVPSAPTDPANEPFLQRIEVHTVDMALDYKPKRVDYAGLRSGRYTEFKNFFILDNAHIVLRHAILYGLRGFDTLNDTLNDIWMPDIKRNQLPGVLSGLATVSPLVNLGTGMAGVISVPISEYKKNGRVVRSIQKGAVHLARDTTGEIARFGARLAVGTQNLLTGAETMLVPGVGASSRRRSANIEGWTDLEEEEKEQRVVSSYANQPLGVLQGLKSARRHLERDLLTARDAFIAVQGEVLESESAGDVVGAVVRHAPTILLRPVIGATRAVGQTLMGVGNQVDRGNLRRMEDKYKQR